VQNHFIFVSLGCLYVPLPVVVGCREHLGMDTFMNTVDTWIGFLVHEMAEK
jgi:hypothetical protein